MLRQARRFGFDASRRTTTVTQYPFSGSLFDVSLGAVETTSECDQWNAKDSGDVSRAIQSEMAAVPNGTLTFQTTWWPR